MNNDAGKKEEIEVLCKQIREGSNAAALAAVEILRKKQWLTDSSLWKSYLAGANLSGADLSGASLTDIDLTQANLRGANLTKAEMHEVKLNEADLTGANLTGANITDSNMRDTILEGTIFSDVVCGNTVFAAVDLSAAIGLETSRHLGPSTIGIDTIYRSKGNIPKEFLRRCGVPEIMIEYIPHMMEEALQYYSCFISYSHADKEFAHKLHDTLQAHGIRCWLDEKQLKPGHDVYEEIHRGIKLWDKVILCCSKAAINSWWVHNEIELVFHKEAELTKERGYKVRAMIPLDLDGYIFKGDSAKVVQLRANRFVGNFQAWEDETKFHLCVEELIKALRTDEGREVPPLMKL